MLEKSDQSTHISIMFLKILSKSVMYIYGWHSEGLLTDVYYCAATTGL